MKWPKISVIASDVQAGKKTATQTIKQALAAIAEHSEYQAVLSTTEQRALQRANEIDTRIARGEKVGRLAGVPFIAKDNFLTFGSETTAASNILKGFEAPYQATAIERLEFEGAICVAKANLDAFGHGASTENSDFMVTKNPHDKKRVPGGSSGGPASAVVLDMAPFALGTDTGGSNRQPAAFVGAVGYKPTYGLVSRSGVVAMASSTDTVGPLAKNVEDAALILDIISGKDSLDSTTIDREAKTYLPQAESNTKKLTIGVIKEHLGEGLDSQVKQTVVNSVQAIRDAGYNVEEISLPFLPLSLACYYIIVPAEISSNLSRYDGQRYGHFEPLAKNIDESYELSRSVGFGAEAKRRIMIGTYVLSSGYYDAYYKKAQQLRTKLVQEFNEAFQKVDILLGPTAPTTAFEAGKLSSDPLQMYLQDIYTVAPSLAGIPAVSIPCGVDKNGLPVGLHLMGRERHDKQLLQFAWQVERLLK